MFSVTIWVWTSSLSPLSCIRFIRLLSILLWFIETEKKNAFIKSFLWVKGIYRNTRATARILLLALLQRYAVCSLKLSFLSIVALADFHKLRSQLNNQAMEVLLLCQEKMALILPCFYAFFARIFKSFIDTISSLVSTPYLFFLIL